MARKSQIRWLLIALLALATAGLLAFLFAPRPLAVDVAVATRGPIAETAADQGQARVRQAYVVSAPVAGRLERLPLEVGDTVVAGRTIVARLRPTPPAFLDPRARAQAEAAIAAANSAQAAAEAQAQRLKAEVVRSAADLDRTTTLWRKGFAAQAALDNARAAADAARSALVAAEADVRARRADVVAARSALTGPEAAGAGLVTVTSPAGGVVVRLDQQSERAVAAGAPLIEIGDTHGLEAQIEFLSQDAVRMRQGQRAEIYDWGGARPIPAEVRLVEPQGYTKISALGVEEQRALVMLQFTGPPSSWAGLAPGYRVWGRVFLRETPSALLAPLGALVRDNGGWAVFRLEDGRARLRPVQVGAITDRQAEILSGLAAGDRLVVFPSDKVRDGVRVRPRAEGR
ncbi:efflux RND transporter periplasmic adaptor subunit [Caulobacter sp. KR2-114]|uniref:efflux RND transporter periplasmic adaptor subunit n=1 Tax=Caulobacter sp. KR2-114 TaxID=3400912 RepID=UPI003C0E7A45